MHLPGNNPGAAALHSPLRTTLNFYLARIPASRAKHFGLVSGIKRRISSWVYIQATNVRPAVATTAWSFLLPEAAQALALPPFPTGEMALMDTGGAIWWPLLLSTVAGLSTAIGGLIAVSFAPSESTLAFLLGTAIGVMATVSGVELWWHSAVEQNDFIGITAAVAAGAVLFAVLDRLLPEHGEDHSEKSAAVAATEQQHDHVSICMDVVPRQHNNSSSSSTSHSSTSNGAGRHAISSSSNAAGRHDISSTNMHSSIQAAADAELDSAPLLQGVHNSSSSSGTSRPSRGSSRHKKADTEQRMQRDKAVHFQADVSDTVSLRDTQTVHTHTQPVSTLRLNSTGHVGNAGGERATEQQQKQQQPHHQAQQQQQHGLSIAAAVEHNTEEQQRLLRAHHAGMLRLGLLMTVTLTVHNLPEGFAVAFSAFTNIGPIMALAIALHNIPEGLVIAAPLYAATGSKLKALGMTAASGLSEPVGALLALLVFKPFVTSIAQLDYVLAVTGGVMLAVCVLELWPEGVRCGQTARLIQGIVLGTVIMGWTLYVGV